MRNQIGEPLQRWRKLALVTVGITVFATPIVALHIQTRPEASPKWEVVSIKPCPENTLPDFSPGPRGGGGPASPPATPFIFSADRMTLNCRPVRFLIRSAYQTYLEPGAPGSSPKDDVLVGMGRRKTPMTTWPAWIDSERYTIEAKAERVTDRGMMQGAMLQAILEDRFKLKVHWETRESAVYALVVAKGGPKLKPFQEGSCIPFPEGFFFPTMFGPAQPPAPPQGQRYCGFGGGVMGRTGNAGYYAEGATIDEFVKLLLSSQSRFVIDKTGLTGKFNINVEYRLEDADRQQFADATGVQLPESAAPLLFDALEEQLGLKLESVKAPVEFLVIDRIERPSPN